MPNSADSQIRFSEPLEGEAADYRAVSRLAVAALLLGLISSVAMLGVAGWTVPLLGAIVSIGALVHIRRSGGTLAGRSAAIAGLALCTLFGTAATAEFFNTQRLLSDRAERLALEWFEALAHGEPQLAHQLGSGYMQRARVSDAEQLWTYYRGSSDRRRSLEAFVKEPLIRTLLALDGRAKFRLYDTSSISADERRNALAQVYAVTFEEDGQRKTFFVALTLERSAQRGNNRVDWRVANYSVADPR
jgi:hypothetical protein